MKISVIVPVYNVEAYLSECIDSVLSQSYHNFEIVLVDDGSTDNSRNLCDNYAANYPEKISVIHTENRGLLQARICGMHHVHGDVLMFLDSDDTIAQDALETLSTCFREYACDMVMFDTSECDDFLSRKIDYAIPDGYIFDSENDNDLFFKLISGQIPNSVCLKAVRAECIQAPLHISTDKRIVHGEDLLLSAWLFTNCKKVVYRKCGLYHYRMRPGSAVQSFDPKRMDSVKFVHTEIAKLMDQCGLTELKPIHNARKVRGCVDNLLIVFSYKRHLAKKDFYRQLLTMAEDPYFLSAYENMDREKLTIMYRMIAFCLKKKQYWLVSCIVIMGKVERKLKKLFRR